MWWITLEVDKSADKKTIRRSYANKIKGLDQEKDIDEFIRVNKAYNDAKSYLDSKKSSSEDRFDFAMSKKEKLRRSSQIESDALKNFLDSFNDGRKSQKTSENSDDQVDNTTRKIKAEDRQAKSSLDLKDTEVRFDNCTDEVTVEISDDQEKNLDESSSSKYSGDSNAEDAFIIDVSDEAGDTNEAGDSNTEKLYLIETDISEEADECINDFQNQTINVSMDDQTLENSEENRSDQAAIEVNVESNQKIDDEGYVNNDPIENSESSLKSYFIDYFWEKNDGKLFKSDIVSEILNDFLDVYLIIESRYTISCWETFFDELSLNQSVEVNDLIYYLLDTFIALSFEVVEYFIMKFDRLNDDAWNEMRKMIYSNNPKYAFDILVKEDTCTRVTFFENRHNLYYRSLGYSQFEYATYTKTSYEIGIEHGETVYLFIDHAINNQDRQACWDVTQKYIDIDSSRRENIYNRDYNVIHRLIKYNVEEGRVREAFSLIENYIEFDCENYQLVLYRKLIGKELGVAEVILEKYRTKYLQYTVTEISKDSGLSSSNRYRKATRLNHNGLVRKIIKMLLKFASNFAIPLLLLSFLIYMCIRVGWPFIFGLFKGMGIVYVVYSVVRKLKGGE